MNLNDMKTAWQEYDEKLQSAQVLTEKLIHSMIKDRSCSRLVKVKRQYLMLLLFMIFWVLVDLAVLVGNPFDYTKVIEYVPIGIRFACMLVLIFALLRFVNSLSKIDINPDSLTVSLDKVIRILGKYEKPEKLLGVTLKVMLFSSAVLFPLSFLPRKVGSMGLLDGLVDTIIPIAIGITLIVVAQFFGAFKSRQGEKFQEDLNELTDLKKLSEELRRG